jgi:hypothetical protein
MQGVLEHDMAAKPHSQLWERILLEREGVTKWQIFTTITVIYFVTSWISARRKQVRDSR